MTLHRPSARPARRFRIRPTVDRLEGRALMAFAGSLDPTFGRSGIYSSVLQPGASSGLAYVSASAIESDGSILEAGKVGTGGAIIGLIHLTASGAVDPSFGTGGEADVTFPSGFLSAGPTSLVVEPDGDIVVAGNALMTGQTTDSTFVERLTPAGTPDTTFGTGGQVILGAGGTSVGEENVQLAALQSNGQIVLAGYGPIPGSPYYLPQIEVTRLNADGTLDTTFGTDGVTDLVGAEETGQLSTSDLPTGLAIQPNGQIVVVGSLNIYSGGLADGQSAEIYRLNTDGTQDTSLSETALQSSILRAPSRNGLAILPGGQIVLAGTGTLSVFGDSTYNGPLVVELGLDGSIVASDELSPPLVPLSPTTISFEGTNSLGVASDGDIVVGLDLPDVTTAGSNPLLGVIRLKPDLTPDDTFGTAGFAPVPLPTLSPSTSPVIDYAQTLVAPGGQIVVAADIQTGSSTSPTQTNVVDRLLPTGTSAHEGDFTGDGIADPAVFLQGTSTFVIGNSGGGAGQVVQLGIPGAGQTIPAPGNYYGTGQEDIAAYIAELGIYVIKDPTGQTAGIALNFGAQGVGNTIPVPADYFGTGQDDVAVYLTQTGYWSIFTPGFKSILSFPFGDPGVGNTIPVPGDYFATGVDDVAVYLPQTGAWSILEPGLSSVINVNFGIPGVGNTIPVPGDYDGSGHTELGIYLPSLGELQYINGSNQVVTVPFGVKGAGQTLPETGDFDGSGKTEIGAYIPSTNTFEYQPASGGAVVAFPVGFAADGPIIPVTNVVSSTGTMSAAAVDSPGVMGEADMLDFLIPPASSRKSKPGDSTTD